MRRVKSFSQVMASERVVKALRLYAEKLSDWRYHGTMGTRIVCDTARMRLYEAIGRELTGNAYDGPNGEHLEEVPGV